MPYYQIIIYVYNIWNFPGIDYQLYFHWLFTIDAAQMESFDNPGAMVGTVSNVWEQLLVDVA